MNKIKFSHDWNNKLTGTNTIFTTIRSNKPGKDVYYVGEIGTTFDVCLNGKDVCRATLLDVEKRILSDIPMGLIQADTGLSDYSEAIELFGKFGIQDDDDALILSFEKVRR